MSTNGKYGQIDTDTDSFLVTQDKDINITDYVIVFSLGHMPNLVSGVYFLKNGSWIDCPISEKGYRFAGARDIDVYKIDLSFKDRIEKIKFTFQNNLADDYILAVKYIEASRDAYFAEQEQKKKEEAFLKASSIKHSTGNDLVNIYFQPCCEEYQRTEITLYHEGNLLAQYKVDEEAFFKSIGGLAYGTYEYVVIQFGKDNKLLLETDKIKFSISAPHYGGKPTIIW